MKFFGWLFLVWLACIVMAALTGCDRGSPTEPSRGPVRVSGAVLDRKGAHIARVEVWLNFGEQVRIESPDGTFTHMIPTGPLTVTAIRDGYFMEIQRFTVPCPPIVIVMIQTPPEK